MHAVEEGKLDIRADAEKFPGVWRKILRGTNEIIDMLARPARLAEEYIDRISKGDTPDKITAEYKGDFNQIKNSLNANIDIISSFVDEIGILMNATGNGKLDIRANADNFPGVWRKILKGTNEVVDMLVAPTKLAGEYVDRISRGVTPERITAEYKGDFNQIKNSLNANIDIISGFVDEIGILMNAVRDGKLDIRANADNFPGVWRKILKGTNEVVDDFVRPLNIAAEYIDRIGKGDIPEKITDEYKGDFNEIKNNVNLCIDGLEGLVESSAVLHKLAINNHEMKVEGRYQGIYAETAQSVNGVRERLLAVATVNNNIAVGDFAQDLKMYKEIGKRSEEDQLVPSYIAMMENIMGMGEEVIGLTNAAEEGKLDYRADAARFKGQFREVVLGVNNAVNAFVAPLNIAAEYIDRISKGDIPEKITDEYKGDFNEIKDNINACIDGLGGLVESSEVLRRMARNDYTLKVEGEYQGIFAETARAVNGVQAILVDILNICLKIADGDNIKWLERLQKLGKLSKEDVILPAFINMMENIDALGEEVIELTIAAEAGKLGYRADTGQLKGKFNEVIQGVNNTVDAFVTPLNMTAGYIDRISKGDIPEKITTDYRGDFNEIKDNINVLIEALDEVTVTAKEIAGGNLTVQIEERSAQDELMRSLKAMVNNLQDIAIGLRDNSNELAGSAQELSANAEEITAGANETAATMVQVAATVAQVSDNAIEIKAVADRASAEAESGQEDVNTVNSQMRDISESTDNAANVVKELNNTSNKIGKIVETIANIASQTNLLALNAAIEAARACDHGRGFAVVAEEVRKLAEQSATAAEEIRELITNIQRESNQAVEVMNESMERVESGVEIVNHTGESFAQIIGQVKALAQQVDEIASGIEETSAAIQNVTNITKESTAATEDMANATEAQAELAADLQEMAARFKLN